MDGKRDGLIGIWTWRVLVQVAWDWRFGNLAWDVCLGIACNLDVFRLWAVSRGT